MSKPGQWHDRFASASAAKALFIASKGIETSFGISRLNRHGYGRVPSQSGA